MPRRTAKFASALFVTILAGVPIATMAQSEPATGEDCLSGPKGETPAGSHWRYHIDHINKRNCWYLRRDGGAVSQVVPQNSPPAPSPVAKPSIVDAHAELRGRPGLEDTSTVNPPASSAANEAAAPNAPVWNATAAVATRWPDLPAASTVPNAGPATASAASNVTQPSADQPDASAPTASPASFLYVPVKPQTIPTLLAAILGTLALAGAAALISRRGRSRRVRRRHVGHARAPVWETTDDDRIVLSDHPSMGNRNYRPRFARGVESATVSVNNRTPEFARRRSRHTPG